MHVHVYQVEPRCVASSAMRLCSLDIPEPHFSWLYRCLVTVKAVKEWEGKEKHKHY